jgi:hypothetical protein
MLEKMEEKEKVETTSGIETAKRRSKKKRKLHLLPQITKKLK